jgi:menaquinone-dependent protoporphyrinogen oxidase
MKILIAYATTDGQTRKIVRFCADHLVHLGHTAELLPAADSKGLELSRFDAVLLAGSVHAGHYQKDLIKMAKRSAKDLSQMPNMFLSVSLAAAGDDAQDWKGLKDCVAGFSKQTGWTPGRVLHVAGAFKFTEYDFFRSWAMRWIAAQKGQTVDPKVDKEYTDWAALKSATAEWLATVTPRSSGQKVSAAPGTH